ncbi:MAG TPA: hypothetical protein DEP78_03815 [Verrucomicrobiales bacterium]|nr:hypothetical protein [Verrucomicrobiales bacterium]
MPEGLVDASTHSPSTNDCNVDLPHKSKQHEVAQISMARQIQNSKNRLNRWENCFGYVQNCQI